MSTPDPLQIGDYKFDSRLFLGTGKFSSNQIMSETIIASESNMVTVALRRVNIEDDSDSFIEHITSVFDSDTHNKLIPNTSGARNAEEAIRLARLAKNATGNKWVKLEVTPDPDNLLPDPIETFLAAKTLNKEGFIVLPYMNADPILAKKLEDIGCPAVMPLGAPIGTNKGLKTKDQLQMILDKATVPVIVDAGIGAPSHASLAMEMGAAAVLVNTAIAVCRNPIEMASAFKHAVIAGRKAYLSGLATLNPTPTASSPLVGFLNDY